MNDKEIIRAIDESIKKNRAKSFPTSVMLDGHVVSNGEAILEFGHGTFYPTDAALLANFPEQGGILKRLDTGELWPLTEFLPHQEDEGQDNVESHVHFRIGRKC